MDSADARVPIEALLAHRGWVRWLAQSLVADPGAADDLEQQAWLAALSRPPREGGSARSWLATVLRRAASKGRRSAVRRESRERGAAHPEAAPSAAEVVAQAELHGRVVRAVLDLEEPYRSSILLRYFEDLPPREVAARMGVPVETARSRVQRAVAMLRERFERESGGDRAAWALGMARLAAPRPAAALPAAPVLATAFAAAAVLALVAGVVAYGLSKSRERGEAPTTTARATQADDARPAGPAPADATLAARPASAALDPSPAVPAPAVPAGSSPPAPVVAAAPAARAGGPALSGRVTRGAPDGPPVAGARVVATRFDSFRGEEDASETTTDSDGRYAFLHLRGRDTSVVVFAPGLTPRGIARATRAGWNPLGVSLEPGGAATLDVVMVPGAIAAGRVVDSAGHPVPRAGVRALFPVAPLDRSYGVQPLPPWTTTAGEDGGFRFDSLAAGASYEFEAAAPAQHMTRTKAIDVPSVAAVAIEIRMLPSRSIDVRVVDAEADTPVVGAEVQAYEDVAPGRSQEVPGSGSWKSGPDGRVRIGPCLAGAVGVRAKASGYPLPDFGPLTARVAPGETSCVVLLRRTIPPTYHDRLYAELDGKGTTLRILAPDGSAVPQARFVAYHWSRQPGGGLAVSGMSGRVEGGSTNIGYGSPPCEFAEVFDAGDADGAPLPYGAARVPHGGVREIEIRLVPEKVITGVVLDADGVGARGVLVSAQPAWWPEGPSLLSRLAHSSGRTDSHGEFRLGGLADTDYRLVLSLPGSLAARRSDPVPAGSTGVVLRTHSTATVTLTVLDSAGVPVPGVVLRVLPAGADPRDLRRIEDDVDLAPPVTSDARGSVVLSPLDPEAGYELTLDPPSSRPDLLPQARDPWRPRDQTLTLGIVRVIRGRVHDALGSPVEEVEVSWTTTRGGGGRSVPAAADGSFVLQGVAPGDVILIPHFREQRYSPRGPQARTVPVGAEDVDLVFDPGLTLVVRVENAPPQPVRAQLVLDKRPGDEPLGANGGAGGGRPPTDGVLRFRGLLPGRTYSLSVSPVAGMSLIREGVRPEDGEIRVRLEPGLKITGRLVVPEGSVEVRVQLNDGRISSNAVVDAAGTYVFDGLPAGSYDLIAAARKGSTRLEGRITVRAGESADIDLRPR